jgi:hypothetical protein
VLWSHGGAWLDGIWERATEVGLGDGGGDAGGRRRRGEMIGGLGLRGEGIPRWVAWWDTRG